MNRAHEPIVQAGAAVDLPSAHPFRRVPHERRIEPFACCFAAICTESCVVRGRTPVPTRVSSVRCSKAQMFKSSFKPAIQAGCLRRRCARRPKSFRFAARFSYRAVSVAAWGCRVHGIASIQVSTFEKIWSGFAPPSETARPYYCPAIDPRVGPLVAL